MAEASTDLLRTVLRAETPMPCPTCRIGHLAVVLDTGSMLLGCVLCGSLWAPQRWVELAQRCSR